MLRDGSYNLAVQYALVEAYQGGDVLLDDDAADEVVEAHLQLLDSQYPLIRNCAQSLLHRLVYYYRDFLPRIKPVLEKVSRITDHRPRPAGLALLEYLGTFWSRIPDESAGYVGRLCRNNTDSVIDSSSVLDTIECMLMSGRLSLESMLGLLDALALLDGAGMPRAGRVLHTARLRILAALGA